MKGTQRATKNAIGKKNAKIQIVDNIKDLVNLVTENVWHKVHNKKEDDGEWIEHEKLVG